MNQPANALIVQIDDVLAQYTKLRAKSQSDDCHDQGAVASTEMLALLCSKVERLAPSGSHYIKSIKTRLDKVGATNRVALPYVVGTLRALRTAYQSGYLASISELLHADLFGDFLEMADYLLAEGYKDSAAVLAGSVLEEHLRQLCAKAGIDPAPDGKPKKADTLNAELASSGVYSKLDPKSVTAWSDLRNKAAHGKYSEYTKEQVALLSQSIRDFITRLPA
jgi:hypothetical protein